MASNANLRSSSREKWDDILIHKLGTGLTATIGAVTGLVVGGPSFLILLGGFTAFAAMKKAKVDVPSLVVRQNYQNIIPPDSSVRKMVERLSKKAGLEKAPSCIYAQERAFQTNKIPFAGAMGTGESGAIIVSRNIDKKLTPSELEAVLAHEITHIKNADTKRMAFQGTLSQMASASLFYAAITSGLAIIGMAAPLSLGAGIIAAAGVAASVGVMAAVSRAVERKADKGSVELTNNPWALASALGRIVEIQMDTLKQMHKPKPGRLGRLITNIFRSHPKTKSRRHSLMDMGRQLIEHDPNLEIVKRRTAKEVEIFERMQKMRVIASERKGIQLPDFSDHDDGPTLGAFPKMKPLSDIKAHLSFNRFANEQDNTLANNNDNEQKKSNNSYHHNHHS